MRAPDKEALRALDTKLTDIYALAASPHPKATGKFANIAALASEALDLVRTFACDQGLPHGRHWSPRDHSYCEGKH
jgi:hypothetical protein